MTHAEMINETMSEIRFLHKGNAIIIPKSATVEMLHLPMHPERIAAVEIQIIVRCEERTFSHLIVDSSKFLSFEETQAIKYLQILPDEFS